MTEYAFTTLNLRDAVALSTVLRAAQTNARVTWLVENGETITGVARHIVHDPETAAFLNDDDDVRDGYLRVSSTFEHFLPVREVIELVWRGEFVIEAS